MPSRLFPTLLALALAGTPAINAQQSSPDTSQVNVRLIADEPLAVMGILLDRGQRNPIDQDAWTRLFTSEGYIALKRREAAMGREFSDSEFKSFVLSDMLAARAGDLAAALGRLAQLDVNTAAGRALAYLPPGTPLKARLFLEIKPQTNSFVFDLDGTRAIFLYVDPAQSADEVSNTMAHELHHVGLGAACNVPEDTTLPAPVREARNWASAFGEGLAMLAAAGGPGVHPHSASDSTTRARWDHDLANFSKDVGTLQTFFTAVLDGRLTGDSLREAGMSFFGVQGPWYTVGWKMAVTIELMDGRERLISVMCDPTSLLSAYNQAAEEWRHRRGESLILWEDGLIRRMGGQATSR